MIDRLGVIEIIRPTKSGQTEPFQCRLEDERIYAVKGRSALPQGLIAEVCAAALGRTIGLPIPEFVIADIPAVLIDSSRFENARRSLGVGPAFASLWQDSAAPITPNVRDRINSALLATIYVFDHWIANGDRSLGEHDGNPNLLFRLADERLIVFDHNLAFSHGYEAKELMVHAGRKAWLRLSGDTSFRSDLLTTLMSARALIDDIIEELPEEWLEENEGFPTLVKHKLDRIGTSEFWDELG